MKISTTSLVLGLAAMLSSCEESPSARAKRLQVEAVEIQNSALRSILENDLKFTTNLDEEEEFFSNLKAELERCRKIEAQLRAISSTGEVLKLEEDTTEILLAISKREEKLRELRDHIHTGRASADHTKAIEALQRTIELRREAGQDTTEAEKLLDQLRTQQPDSEQPQSSQTTPDPH